MAETAANLVDRVLPRVPVRRWVLSLPFALRYRMAFDAKLTSEVLTAFIQTLFASLRSRARVSVCEGSVIASTRTRWPAWRPRDACSSAASTCTRLSRFPRTIGSVWNDGVATSPVQP